MSIIDQAIKHSNEAAKKQKSSNDYEFVYEEDDTSKADLLDLFNVKKRKSISDALSESILKTNKTVGIKANLFSAEVYPLPIHVAVTLCKLIKKIFFTSIERLLYINKSLIVGSIFCAKKTSNILLNIIKFPFFFTKKSLSVFVDISKKFCNCFVKTGRVAANVLSCTDKKIGQYLEGKDGAKDVAIDLCKKIDAFGYKALWLIKRPIFILILFVILVISCSSIFLSSKQVEVKQLAEAHKIINDRKTSAAKKTLAKISSENDEKNNNDNSVKAIAGIVSNGICENAVADFQVVPTVSNNDNSKRFKALVDLFLVDHPVTDVVCTSKGGAIKIDRDVFVASNTISNSPHIIIENITEDTVVFCDKEGHKYEKSIESLME